MAVLGGARRTLLLVAVAVMSTSPRREVKPGVKQQKLARGERKTRMLALLAFLDNRTSSNGDRLYVHTKELAKCMGVTAQTALDDLNALHDGGWIVRPASQRYASFLYGDSWQRRTVVVVNYEHHVGGIAVADWLADNRARWSEGFANWKVPEGGIAALVSDRF